MSDVKFRDQLNAPIDMDKLEPLKYTEFSEYFDAIAGDNAVYVDALLAEADSRQRHRLTNAEFDFKDVECPFFRAEVEKEVAAIYLPLHVAVTNNAMSVAGVLLTRGANVVGLDSSHNNILHACVITAFYHPELEQALCECLLKFAKICEKSSFYQMLMQENQESFRPVEFATQQGTIGLVNVFMWSMSNDHKTRVEHHGMTTYTWHDVTEYESPTRHGKSPLLLLTYMDHKKAVKAGTRILECPFFGEWIKAKVRINIAPMIAWAVLRIVFVIVYCFLDRNDRIIRDYYKELKNEGQNVSEPCYTDMAALSTSSQNILIFFVFIYSIISVFIDIFEIMKSTITKEYKKGKDLKGWKDMIVKFHFYRICTFTVSVAIPISTVIKETPISFGKSSPVSGVDVQVLSVCRILIPICACWSIMYFMQVLPYIGRSIVSIQGMLVGMANVLVLWCLIMLPFIHTFNVLVNNYSKQGCIEEFDGIMNTLYTLFRMMLNMVELTQYDFYQDYFLYILHVIYVFMVAIILINFLIAIMSESASRTAENELIISWLNSLCIAFTIQQRFGSWILKPYYSFMMPRVFTKDHNGRFCIVTRICRRDHIKQQQE